MSIKINTVVYYPKINEVTLKIEQVKRNSQDIMIKDVWGYKSTGTWEDEVDLNVNYTSTNTFIRNFNNELDFTVDKHLDYTKNLPTTLVFGVTRLGNAGQVIGDIRFYDKVLNETNWDETLTPFGYGKWKIMITDDYIYEKALCKYVMQASLNADRPNTREYLHKVDVPDRVDTGTVELDTKNQPYHVKFTPEDVRAFHIVPELNVSIKSYSGTGDSPIIIPYNVTAEGFDVTMKVDGAFVEGSITYAARGY